MIIKYNGFAFKITRCKKCGRDFWLERYRKEGVWNIFTGKTAYEPVCKRCVESGGR